MKIRTMIIIAALAATFILGSCANPLVPTSDKSEEYLAPINSGTIINTPPDNTGVGQYLVPIDQPTEKLPVVPTNPISQ